MVNQGESFMPMSAISRSILVKKMSKLKVNATSAKNWREIFEQNGYAKKRESITVELERGDTKVFRISSPLTYSHLLFDIESSGEGG